MRSCNLHTSRLALIHAGPADFWALWDLWSETDIARRLFGQQQVTLDLATTIFESRQAAAQDGLGIWLVKPGDSSAAVGFLSLARRPLPRAEDDTPLHDEVELQVAVRSRARRLGFALEAARALVRHAFTDPDLPLIAATCDAADAAPNRLLARLGFRSHAMDLPDLGASRRRHHTLSRLAFAAAQHALVLETADT